MFNFTRNGYYRMSNKYKTVKTIGSFDFIKMLGTESKARNYLEKILWKHGRVCPKCNAVERSTPCKNKDGFYQCKNCRKEFSVRHGTIFASSKLSLSKWLYAMYLLQTARKGISSLQLSKELDVTQKTAWFLLHRLREVCTTQSSLLYGIVEVDETYIGGKEANKHNNKKVKGSQGGANKSIVMGMKQRNGKVKAEVINNTKTDTLQAVLSNNVSKNTLLMTDELRGYKGVQYDRMQVNHSAKEYVNGMAHTNSIESVWAVLKRGYNGVYHNFSAKHLQRYVNEFTFRLNEGSCKIDTMDRILSMVKNSTDKRLMYRELIA